VKKISLSVGFNTREETIDFMEFGGNNFVDFFNDVGNGCGVSGAEFGVFVIATPNRESHWVESFNGDRLLKREE
jgi:hypothetical protein